ncbi:MAG: hypothetical protein L6Q57_02880 [Alphaproteobacteria bacterium]|nr:hypothetical protein [Alphaproteobacteria bacterium]
MLKSINKIALLGLIGLLMVGSAAIAQDAQNAIRGNARALDSVTIVLGQQSLMLWGLQPVTGAGAVFDLRARTALDNAMGKAPVECTLRAGAPPRLQAQCTNANGMDLALYMLQHGYATTNRGQIFNTVFEDPYVKAEIQAQDQSEGIWAKADAPQKTESSDGKFFFVLAFILLAGMVGAFIVLSLMIMRGFQRVIDAQRDTLDMMVRERKLRDKERAIIASLLDAELRTNKSKIEAYLVVYEETLKALKDEDRIPKYKKSGDIVQSEPVLDRAVFDRNTDRLDILGARLGAQIIAFYADVKASPDYITIEPEMDRKEVVQIVDKAVQRARMLSQSAAALIEAFAKNSPQRGEER